MLGAPDPVEDRLREPSGIGGGSSLCLRLTSSMKPRSLRAGTEAARDFFERRAEMWPDVHVEHVELHDVGETLAEVAEGYPWPIGHV